MEANFAAILPLLTRYGVKFIVIGRAAIAHGSARLTSDVDVVYSRDPDNVRNLVAALKDYEPYLRGAPPGLPFHWAEPTIKSGLNYRLGRESILIFNRTASGEARPLRVIRGPNTAGGILAAD
jgi:hypothetical protein